MSTDTLQLSSLIPADPPTLFAAWLDSAGHTAMTGAAAIVEARAGTKFTAWDGYISGTTLELDPGRRIVQTWRTSEFPEDAPDSQLEILLEPEGNGTRVTLLHTEIPPGQGDRYRSGWEEFYFAPMRRFFAQPDSDARGAEVTPAEPADERATTRPGKTRGNVAPPAPAARASRAPKAKAKAKAKPKVKAKARPAAKKAKARPMKKAQKAKAAKKAKARPAKKAKAKRAAKKKRR